MTPSQIILAGKALALLAVLGLVYWLGGQSARTDLAEYKTKVAERATHVADLATKASELARKSEQAQAVALAAVAEQYERDKVDAKDKSDRVIADLHSDRLRLQNRWAGCPVPEAQSGPAIADAGADDRAEGAAAIVRAAAEADAQIRGLQEIIRADRK